MENTNRVTRRSSRIASRREFSEKHHETEHPPIKRPKLADEPDLIHPDWTKLPPEILLEIFGHLKPEDNCTKPLTETCKVFGEFCVPRVYRLDFNRIERECQFPVLYRTYQEIRLTGKKIRGTEVEFCKVLAGTRNTVKTLSIGSRIANLPGPEWRRNWRRSWQLFMPEIRRLGTQISSSRLQFLLKYFPYLENVEIEGVATAITKATELGVPELPKLKKLQLRDVNGDFLKVFIKVKTLEELRLGGDFDRYTKPLIRKLISSQKSLKLLNAGSIIIDLSTNSLPNLQKFEGYIKNQMYDIFAFAPQLKHLQLEVANGNAEVNTRDYLLRNYSQTLITLNLIGYTEHADDFLENFPMLDIAKCSPIFDIDSC